MLTMLGLLAVALGGLYSTRLMFDGEQRRSPMRLTVVGALAVAATAIFMFSAVHSGAAAAFSGADPQPTDELRWLFLCH